MSPALCATIRTTLADPDVAVVGCVGAIGVRSIAWWEGVGHARLVHQPLRGARRRRPASFSWDRDEAPPYARAGEVETLDGFVLALALGGAQRALRRVARRIPRLRPRLLPAGPRGRPQGRDRRLPRDPSPAAPDAARPGRMGRGAHPRSPRSGTAACRASGAAPGTWRERALRAEAERDAAHAIAHSTALEIEARTRELEHVTRETRDEHLLAARRLRCGCSGAASHDRLRQRPSRPPAYRATRGRASSARREADSDGVRDRAGRVDLPRLQPDPRPGRRARRPRGARARRRGHRDRRPRLLRQGPARARRPGRRRRRLRRRDRRRERRLVGRRGERRTRHVPLQRVRRRRARPFAATRAGSPAGGGRHGRRLPARAVAVGGANAALRRVLGSPYGYDLDFALRLRQAGRKVVTADCA